MQHKETVMKYDMKLLLEDGQEYYGYSFGGRGKGVYELVFNTSMTGYQEILSDPSYAGQAVVMSYPLIGNYGMADGDYESEKPSIGALVVREYNERPSGSRCAESLGSVMERQGIIGISGIDTRKLVRSIRDYGSRKALIADSDLPKDEGLKILSKAEIPDNLARQAGCKKAEHIRAEHEDFHVAALDCGMKQNIIRTFNKLNCSVTKLPFDTPVGEILLLKPDGLFISNGPGNPVSLPETIETVRCLKGRIPIFGICLGHQILSLSYGAETYKLKFGHRGGNHPVKNLSTGKVEITSQNHSYAVDMESLTKTALSATHINLLDGTVEGVCCAEERAFGVQYHPEGAPGPMEGAYLFKEFAMMMEGCRNA